MSKTIVLYGSSTGNTEDVAKKIAKLLEADVSDIVYFKMDRLPNYDQLILGTSTWGFGDMQDDWEVFISQLDEDALNGKTVALFGLGDGDSYSDTFVNGMGQLYNNIKDRGCKLVGFTDPEGYNFDNPDVLVDGQFPGLALDEDNQSNKTDARIQSWLEKIKSEF